jgi:hypothetical protein
LESRPSLPKVGGNETEDVMGKRFYINYGCTDHINIVHIYIPVINPFPLMVIPENFRKIG